MLDITHLQLIPLPLFNKLEEVRVRSHMSPSMYECLRSPEKVNLVVFIFRESENNLKMTPMLSFFVILVLRGRKRDKLSLEICPFKRFNEWERKQDHSTIVSCLESLKRV
jgi:hypothetical protein